MTMTKPGVVEHAYKSSSQETEVVDHKFKASLGFKNLTQASAVGSRL
jgi:hypothetical protein